MALFELERFEFEFSARGIFRILDHNLNTVSRSQAEGRIGLTNIRSFLKYLLLVYRLWIGQVDPILRDLDHFGVALEVELVNTMRTGIENSPALRLTGL